MKKTIAILACIAAALVGLAFVAFGAEQVGPDAPAITLLSAKTATGAGTEFELLRSACQFSCTATWGGTAPTSITFWVQLTDETTVYDTTTGAAVLTMSASPYRFDMLDRAGKFIRGNYVSKVGGDGTTSITLKCVPIR